MWYLLLLLFYSPADFDVTFRAALLALQQNDLRQARIQLESAAQMRPNHPQVWVALARTYWKLHHVEAAESAALKAEQLGRDDPAVLYGLGFFYSEKGDFERVAGFQARLLVGLITGEKDLGFLPPQRRCAGGCCDKEFTATADEFTNSGNTNLDSSPSRAEALQPPPHGRNATERWKAFAGEMVGYIAQKLGRTR